MRIEQSSAVLDKPGEEYPSNACGGMENVDRVYDTNGDTCKVLFVLLRPRTFQCLCLCVEIKKTSHLSAIVPATPHEVHVECM